MRMSFWSLAVVAALSPSIWTDSGTAAAAQPSPMVAKQTRDAKNWDVLRAFYPKRALAAGEEGLVGFVVKIDGTGYARECRVTHTSGYPLLDKETCRLITLRGDFKRPKNATRSQIRTFEGVVNWKLPTTSLDKVPAVPKPIEAAAAPDRVVCKRSPIIGTLTGFERVCMPLRDWMRNNDDSRDDFESVRKQGFERMFGGG